MTTMMSIKNDITTHSVPALSFARVREELAAFLSLILQIRFVHVHADVRTSQKT